MKAFLTQDQALLTAPDLLITNRATSAVTARLTGDVGYVRRSPETAWSTLSSATSVGGIGPAWPPPARTVSTVVLPVLDYVERCLLDAHPEGRPFAGAWEVTCLGVLDFVAAVSTSATIFPGVTLDGEVVMLEWWASPHHLIVEFDTRGPFSLAHFIDAELSEHLETPSELRSTARSLLQTMTAWVIDHNPHWRSHFRTP